MENVITYETYTKGDREAVIHWREEINEILRMRGYQLNVEKNITYFQDKEGNQFEIFIGPRAQTEILLLQEFDENKFVRGHYLICALEVMLKCFGTKIYCFLNPFRLGFAIDFLYSSKEAFKEMVQEYIDLAIRAREEMNLKLTENE
jgi:hypothetical protein